MNNLKKSHLYRPSDIQLNFLNNATPTSLESSTSVVSEVVIVPSNLQSGVTTTTFHVGSTSGVSAPTTVTPGPIPAVVASAGTPVGVTTTPAVGGIHHPHHRHHRPYSALVRGGSHTNTPTASIASGGSTTISHSTMFTDIP